MSKKDIKIKCPNCGAEYLPSEIFYPKYFFSDPKVIVKDSDGKILHYSGSNMQLKESYTCDYCLKDFDVTAKITFNSELDKKYEFDKEYEIRLKSNISLKEQ